MKLLDNQAITIRNIEHFYKLAKDNNLTDSGEATLQLDYHDEQGQYLVNQKGSIFISNETGRGVVHVDKVLQTNKSAGVQVAGNFINSPIFISVFNKIYTSYNYNNNKEKTGSSIYEAAKKAAGYTIGLNEGVSNELLSNYNKCLCGGDVTESIIDDISYMVCLKCGNSARSTYSDEK